MNWARSTAALAATLLLAAGCALIEADGATRSAMPTGAHAGSSSSSAADATLDQSAGEPSSVSVTTGGSAPITVRRPGGEPDADPADTAVDARPSASEPDASTLDTTEPPAAEPTQTAEPTPTAGPRQAAKPTKPPAPTQAAAQAAPRSAAGEIAATSTTASAGKQVPKDPAGSTNKARQPAKSDAADPADPVDAVDPAVERAVTIAVKQAAQQGINQSVVVLDRSSGDVAASVNADAPVPSMSLVKLFIAADLLTASGGADNLDPGTVDRLDTMIETSDDGIASELYATDGAGAIIERTVEKYGLTGTRPADNPRYWGDVQVTAADLASFLRQALTDPSTGPFLESAMTSATDTAADGFDQDFGVNAIAAAGSKQGWGCCLSGVVAIHSVGFTADRIVVVLSTSAPDAGGLNTGESATLTADPGAMAAVRSVSITARAGLA